MEPFMSTYRDYMNREWGRYFTDDFRKKHLRPFFYIPLRGHSEARLRAREGNIGLNQRIQRGQHTGWNSLLFDIDPQGNEPRQVLQLMEEIKRRNEEQYYDRHNVKKNGPICTTEAYYLQTTGHGSRQDFVKRRFYYDVFKDVRTGRYVVCHFGGTQTT